MWFKKKSVLQVEGNYDSNTAVDGTDWRTTSNSHTWSASQTLPSAADAGKYFYLPALGHYSSGQLHDVGLGLGYGYYWSSSASPYYSTEVYYLYFKFGNVGVYRGYRGYGYRVGGFE